MARNEKLETCLNKLLILPITIIMVACAVVGAVMYVKFDALQKDISTLRNDLYMQANENKESIISLNEKISTNIEATKNALHQISELGNTADSALSILNIILNGQKVEINRIKDMSEKFRQIEPLLASNYVVIEQDNFSSERVYNGIGLKLKKGTNSFIVVEVFDGLPAQKAGLYEGDEIVKINGEPTFQMSQGELMKKLRGPKGSTVNLDYKPSGSLDTIKEVTVMRDTIRTRKIHERK